MKRMRNSDTGAARRTGFGRALEQSAREILSHVKGDSKLPVRRVVLPDQVDVKRIRTRAGMSQAEFARAFCINPRTGHVEVFKHLFEGRRFQISG